MVFASVIITMVLWKIVNLGTTMYSFMRGVPKCTICNEAIVVKTGRSCCIKARCVYFFVYKYRKKHISNIQLIEMISTFTGYCAIT